MKQSKGRQRRTEAEIRRLVAGYENGTQKRAAYCAEHGLALTTLDYYRRRFRPTEPALVEVDLRGAVAAAAERPATGGAVAVVLSNRRRLEIEWSDLSRVSNHSQPLRALLHWLEEA